MQIDEDKNSSYFKEAERGEVLDNQRVMLSGENEPEERRSFFTQGENVKISVVM